jgi:hypothetical protein
MDVVENKFTTGGMVGRTAKLPMKKAGDSV